MNNRKSKTFLTLILGTKGKYLPKQKTNRSFSPPQNLSPHTPHAPSKRDTGELGLAPKQGTGRGRLLAVAPQKVQQLCFAWLPLQQMYLQQRGCLRVFYWPSKFGLKLANGFRNYFGVGGNWKDTHNSWNCCLSLISLENYAKRKAVCPPLEHIHTYAK